MKHFEYGLAVERQAATQLALVLAKRILALAGKDWAVLDNHLGVVERHALHGDRSTLKADFPSAVLKQKGKIYDKAEKLSAKSKQSRAALCRIKTKWEALCKILSYCSSSGSTKVPNARAVLKHGS